MRSSEETDQRGREWYLPYHLVVIPNKPGKGPRVLDDASMFQVVSWNKVLLTGPDLLQKFIHTLIRFRQHQFAVFVNIEGMVLHVGVLPSHQTVFVAGGPLKDRWGVSIHSKHLRRKTKGSLQITHCNEHHEILKRSIQTQRRQFMRSSIWMITWTQWILLMMHSSCHETWPNYFVREVSNELSSLARCQDCSQSLKINQWSPFWISLMHQCKSHPLISWEENEIIPRIL